MVFACLFVCSLMQAMPPVVWFPYPGSLPEVVCHNKMPHEVWLQSRHAPPKRTVTLQTLSSRSLNLLSFQLIWRSWLLLISIRPCPLKESSLARSICRVELMSSAQTLLLKHILGLRCLKPWRCHTSAKKMGSFWPHHWWCLTRWVYFQPETSRRVISYAHAQAEHGPKRILPPSPFRL